MPKEILILKHIDIEGPGSIEEFFGNTAWDLRVIDVSREKLETEDFGDLTAIILLGGPMNVYQEDKFPFLKDEEKFLKQALKQKIPLLGICLGAQLLAKACGAKIKKAESKEIGWHRVNLTEEGKRDPLFENLASGLDVFQWHQDTFEIPQGGAHIVRSRGCINQGFRFGRNAYGLQFHIEVTPEMVETWINKYGKEGPAETDGKDMIIQGYKRKGSFRRQADLIYFNFARIIAAGQEAGTG